MRPIFLKLFPIFMVLSNTAFASALQSELFDNQGTSLGTVSFEDSQYGLLIKPALQHLPAGIHGFHVHQIADCGNKGMNAGGHLDPSASNSHQGPYGKGHLGDLPVLVVNAKGESNTPLLAPRLKTSDIANHALMIHEGGDNYSDNPAMGGGGARIGCGKIAASAKGVSDEKNDKE